MEHLWILWVLLGVAAFLTFAVFLTAYICFAMTFYVPKKKKYMTDEEIHRFETAEPQIPEGEIYEVFREDMLRWTYANRARDFKRVSITTKDGLTLRGKFYEHAPHAPINIIFHGYRGWAERDLNGGVFRCAAMGHSALLVDHRGSGLSDGKVITFGVKEVEDCIAWVHFVHRELDPEAKILLGGVSMGAATVMMAAGREDLPDCVVGILEDCGYTSAKEIIKKVVREMKLPADLLYPFIKLGARVYGHFDLDATPPIEAVKKARVPVLFIHGDTDDFVPCDMSRRCFDVCTSPKEFLVIPGAGHGLAYPVDPDGYAQAAKAFFEKHAGV